jgi:squalene synthase HpnC
MSNSHYENFPVASPLLPAHLRAPIRVIYAFARSADDIADEGTASPEERYAALAIYEQELYCIEQQQKPQTQLFQELETVIKQYAIPLQAFKDLLSAFKQDITTTRYTNFDGLLDYCRRSANPVGRIMLSLFKQQTASNQTQSDAICSALQLINFLQDVAIDWEKSRIYLPLEDLARFGITENHIANAKVDDDWRTLMSYQVERARTLLMQGATLPHQIPGRMGWELRMIIQGGLRILEKIQSVDYDVFHRRPQLVKTDWALMLWRACWM